MTPNGAKSIEVQLQSKSGLIEHYLEIKYAHNIPIHRESFHMQDVVNISSNLRTIDFSFVSN